MNEKAIFEIGNIIRVRRSISFRKLLPSEIIRTYEYKMFKKMYPELCRLAEEDE